MWDTQFEEILRRQLPFLPAGNALAPDASLREYGLDSLATVELLAVLESSYRVRFSEELLNLDTFATPTVLWQALSTLRSASTR
jgi:nodulation protein F